MFRWLANTKLNTSTDTLNKAAQILALVVAGWWAYKTFHVSVEPSLEFRGSLDPSISWTKSSDPDDCTGSLDITLTNDGVSSFTISDVSVTGWLYTSDKATSGPQDLKIAKPTPESPVVVNVAEIETGRPFYSQHYDQSNSGFSVVGRYPQGAKYHTSVIFHFKKVRGQGVLFTVDTKTSDKTSQFVPSAWATDDVCTLPDEAIAKKTS